jgi:hypothetical protein
MVIEIGNIVPNVWYYTPAHKFINWLHVPRFTPSFTNPYAFSGEAKLLDGIIHSMGYMPEAYAGWDTYLSSLPFECSKLVSFNDALILESLSYTIQGVSVVQDADVSVINYLVGKYETKVS